MPFCIIFFVVSIVYMIIYRPSWLIASNLGSILICLVISCFISPTYIGNDVAINTLYVASLILMVAFVSRYMTLKRIFVTVSLSLVMGIVYIALLRNDIFVSLDYHIYYALGIGIIPVIVAGRDIFRLLFATSIFSLVFTICEVVFWLSELQYAELNTINLLNLMTAYISIGIVGLGLRRLISIVARRGSAKNV